MSFKINAIDGMEFEKLTSHMDSPQTTILLLGNFRFTLTFIRSLAKAGHRIIMGLDGSPPISKYSRYVSEFWQHPPIEKEGSTFVEALERFLLSRTDVSLVFPLGDVELELLARHYHIFPRSARAVMADPSVILACLDNAVMCHIVSQLGIPQPKFFTVSNLFDLKGRADDVGYPCIVKPINQLHRVFGKKMVICQTMDQLREAFPFWPDGNGSLLIQQYAFGPHHNIHFIAHEGEMLFSVETKKVLTHPRDHAGCKVNGMSAEPNRTLRKYCRRLLKNLNFSGLGCAQFSVEDNLDSVSFLEINPRLGADFGISKYCGIDFPRMAVDLYLNETIGGSHYFRDYPIGK